MKHRSLYLYLLFFSLLCRDARPCVSTATGQEKKQERFTLMGLGDSITEGADFFTCYLYPLWEKLFTAGYQFDFIGPRESKCRIGTLNHCGFSGKNVEFLESKIDSLYRIYPADIVLLHAGHNHFVEEKPVPGMIASYKSIIHKIQEINPNVRILIAQVIPSGKLPKYSYISELNEKIAEMVAGLDSGHVFLVNQAQDFDWQKYTVHDKVHTNKAGAEKMASIWFEALKKVLASPETAFSPEIVPYKTLVKGNSLTLHIFKPRNVKTGEKRPAIVYFFGGGWKLGTPIQFYRECAYYASKGMVAVSVDYRIEYLHHSTPFESFDDAKDAMRWLRHHSSAYQIDPDKIAVAGGSAGGHLAAALGTVGSDEPASADYKPNLSILYYPVVDMVSRGYGFPEITKDFEEISPIHHITAGTPSSLILLGTKDPIVPVKVVESYRDNLLQKEVDCELHLFEGAGHPIFLYRKPLTDNYYRVRELTDAFLKKNGFLLLKQE